MSLILDALRKMELERKAKRTGTTEIRAEVLNYRGNPQAPEKSRLLPIIVALLLFSSAAAVFLYFKGIFPPPAALVRTPGASPVITPVDKPLQASTPRTDPQPFPPVQTAVPTTLNRAAKAAVPTEQTDDSQQSSGNANIAVSGIAWQEERSLRRAVVNGSLVSEGIEVFGAKIIEIRQNLVRFSRDGTTFDVIYTSGAGK